MANEYAERSRLLEQDKSALADKMEGQKFEVLENRCAELAENLRKTQQELGSAVQESSKMEKALRALELKLPLFVRQGKSSVEPPRGDVTLVFTDVEGFNCRSGLAVFFNFVFRLNCSVGMES